MITIKFKNSSFIFSSWRCLFTLPLTYLLLCVRPWGIVPDIALYEVPRRSYVILSGMTLSDRKWRLSGPFGKTFFFRFSKIYATILEKAALDEAIFPKWKGVLPHDLAWRKRRCKLSQTFNVTHYCVVMYAFNAEVKYDQTNNEMWEQIRQKSE